MSDDDKTTTSATEDEAQSLPTTPGALLGHRADGRPIYLIAGGAGEGDGDDKKGEAGDADDDEERATADAEGADEEEPEGAEQLGDAGKKALNTMKGKWHAERDKRRALEQQLAEKQTTDGDGKTDADAIRRQAEQEATARANARVIRSEVRAAAAGKLADPKDALKFLDLDQFEVGADGDVDADEIAEAIDDLIQSKPYLAAATAKRFQGTAESGARKGRTRPEQLSQADLQKMTPEAIDKAREEGRLDDLMGGK